MSLLTALLEEGLTNPLPYYSADTSRREVKVALRADATGVPAGISIGSGTPDDPYDGSLQERFDALLRDAQKITGNMTIKFGPGTFQTRGFGAQVTGFLPLSGQRFVGSGMYQTVLQLVEAVPLAFPDWCCVRRRQPNTP